MKVPGQFGGASRRDISGLPSFAAAGSNLSSPTPSAATFTPPPASRHPLFAHHMISLSTSPSMGSDAVPSAPTTPSEASSSAFSPASAFLSHFSSSNSLRAVPTLAPDSMGARVLDYTLGKIVGRGGFSTVRKATHVSTGETFACKIVKRDDLSDRSGSLERFEEEIKTWQSLPRHPSLLPLIDIHRTPFATFLISPYLPGGSLLDVLKREGGSEKTAAKWFPGVVAAVAVLHEGCEGFKGGLLHGDLKLDNFLVDQAGKVVVADFYMAQVIDAPVAATVPPPMALTAQGPRAPRQPSPHASKSRSKSKSRSPQFDPLPVQPFPSASLPYAPPELLRAPPTQPTLGQDIWALGIILHALLVGRLPFVDQFDPRLQMKILRGQWEVPTWVGKEWIDCLLGCLDGRLDSRWDIKRIRECDAVIGWREVKTRSRSRSRARGRPESRNRNDLLDPRHAEIQPVPIRTPRRAVSREPRASDPFSLPESRSRSASVSGSRSRSSGNGQVFGFSPDITAESLSRLENIAITRGRSTQTKAHQDTLTFSRASPSSSSSRIPNTAPPHMDGFHSNTSRSRSRRRETESPGPRSMQIDGHSPTASRHQSRSRSNHQTPDFGNGGGFSEYGGGLGVVDEEGLELRGRVGRDGLVPGSRGGGRSRSRKRLG